MKYTLTTRDFFKGLLLAVGMAVLTVAQNSISAGTLELDWKNIGLVAAGTTSTYLFKNFFTDDVKQAKTTLKAAAVDTSEVRKVESIVTKK